ncbi:MAG: tetratricopeptide repeat protein [Acidiferrobacterales bacterium]
MTKLGLSWVLAAALLIVTAPVLGGSSAGAGTTFIDGYNAYAAKDYARAMEILKPLAEAGHADAQWWVGRMYEKGQGVDKDMDHVRTWYRRAAKGGQRRAQYKLGVAYARGMQGVEKNEAEAAKWLLSSAEKGYDRAQKVVAHGYKKGKFGFPKDPEKAKYWQEKADAQKK